MSLGSGVSGIFDDLRDEERECVDGDETADVDRAVDPGLVVAKGLGDEFPVKVGCEVRRVGLDFLEEPGALGVGQEFRILGEL